MFFIKQDFFHKIIFYRRWAHCRDRTQAQSQSKFGQQRLQGLSFTTLARWELFFQSKINIFSFDFVSTIHSDIAHRANMTYKLSIKSWLPLFVHCWINDSLKSSHYEYFGWKEFSMHCASILWMDHSFEQSDSRENCVFDEFLTGHEYKALCISVPPDFAKS